MGFLFRHKSIVVLLGLIVAGLAAYGLFSSSGSEQLLTSNPTADAADRDIVKTLLALRTVKLDGTIFSEDAFVRLQDFSTPIVQEPVGRENPFAPIGAAVEATSTTKNSPQGQTQRSSR